MRGSVTIVKKIYFKILLILCISILSCHPALAANDKLPDMMVGYPKVIQGTTTYYGGEAGSQAIYNSAPTGNTNDSTGTGLSQGDNTLLGFDKT